MSWPRRWWLNTLLLLITLLTTTVFGSALTRTFSAGRPFDLETLVDAYVRLTHGDASLLAGLEFSIPLLLILLSHEMGHYVECLRWKVDASWPYFLPSPTLFGTMGAFIRIRSPIFSRRSLFDIGVSGPIAGFVMLIPFLVIGVALSHPLPRGAAHGPFVFSAPLLLRLFEWLKFGHIPSGRLLLHPVAMAAWVGLLATSINLLPMGQLDGGHILYAAFGARWHRIVSTCIIGLLVVLGYFYHAWWFWAVLMFFFGRRHPLVYDQEQLSRGRVLLSIVALAIFALSASVIPIDY